MLSNIFLLNQSIISCFCVFLASKSVCSVLHVEILVISYYCYGIINK